jgi:plasmid stability protein
MSRLGPEPRPEPVAEFVNIGIRLPGDMHAALLARAAAAERSVAAETRVAIRAHLDAGEPLKEAA